MIKLAEQRGRGLPNLVLLSLFTSCKDSRSAPEPLPPRLQMDRDAIHDQVSTHPSFDVLGVEARELLLAVVDAASTMVDVAMLGFDSLDPNRTFGATNTRIEQLVGSLEFIANRHRQFGVDPLSPVLSLPAPPTIGTQLGMVEINVAVVRRVLDPHFVDLSLVQAGFARALPEIPEADRPGLLTLLGIASGATLSQMGNFRNQIASQWRDE